jgi:hypothetical protein
MDINLFLSVKDNFTRVTYIYDKIQETLPETTRRKIKQIGNNYYLVNSNMNNEIISFKNRNYEVAKLLDIVSQIYLLNECENYELEWLNLLYSNGFPKVENKLTYFILTSIGKLLKENKELKDRLNNLEATIQ